MFLEHYLTLACILFGIGLLGLFIRRNAIMMLMCIELMLNAVNLIFVSSSALHGHLSSQIMVFFIMLVAAAEVAVGLALFAALFRSRNHIDVSDLEDLKW